MQRADVLGEGAHVGGRAHRPVAGDEPRRPVRGEGVEGAEPAVGVAVGQVRMGADEEQVAAEDDAVVLEDEDGVVGRVAGAEERTSAVRRLPWISRRSSNVMVGSRSVTSGALATRPAQ
jgi:hypothetical protein